MGATCAIVPVDAEPLAADEAAAIAARLAPLLAEVEWDGAEPIVVDADHLLARRTLMSKAPAAADPERAWTHVCQCTAVALRLSRELPWWRWMIEDDLEIAASGFGVDEVAFRGGRIDGGDDDDRAVRAELDGNLGPGGLALLAEGRARAPRRRRPAAAKPERPATVIGTLALAAPAGGPPVERDPEQLREQRHRAMRGRRRLPVEVWQSRAEPGQRDCTITLDLEAPAPGRGHLYGMVDLFDGRDRKLADVAFSGEGRRPGADGRGVTVFPSIVQYDGECAWARARIERVEVLEPTIERLLVAGVEQDGGADTPDPRVRVRSVAVTLQPITPGDRAASQPVEVALDLALAVPVASLRYSLRFYAAHGGVLREVHHDWPQVEAGHVRRVHEDAIRPLERYARVTCVVTVHLHHDPLIGGLTVVGDAPSPR